MKKCVTLWILATLWPGAQAARVLLLQSQHKAGSAGLSDLGGLQHSLPTPRPFPAEFNLLPKRCPTGSLRVGCVHDTQWGQRRWYHDHVPREDRLPMTPEICFAFCKNASGAQYFGLTRGDKCYCSPFFHSTGKGGTGSCDMPCAGDATRMCGGMEMVDVYSMHDCNNMGEMRCDAPDQPAHAVRYSGAAYDSTPCRNRREEALTTEHASCEIECEPGYELTRNDIRCVHRGDDYRTWAEVAGRATCEPTSCGVPPEASNSRPQQAAAQEVLFPENVTYKCTAGFTVGGSRDAARTFQVHCGVSGFTGVQGCDPVICGTCPVADSASTHASPRELDVQVFGDSCHYDCDRGYTLDALATGAGAYTASCLANGSFAALKTCRPVSCGSVPGVQHATLGNSSVAEVVFPETLRYNCDEGYSIRGVLGGADHLTRQCQADGTFSGLAGCEAIICGSPPEVSNASHSGASVSYPDAATYTCNRGFSTDGQPGGPQSFNVACLPTGFAPPQRCRPVACGTCPVFRLANLLGDAGQKRHYRDECLYKCSTGYSLDHSAQGPKDFSTSCLDTGDFSDAPACVPVSCGAPRRIDNARFTGSPSDGNIYYREAATYSCVSGYSLNREARGPVEFSSECQADGEFAPAQTCRRVSCGPPPRASQATFDSTPRVYGESVTYTCAEGHTLTGSPTGSNKAVLQCAANGTYAGPKPECIPVSCGVPQELPQAQVQNLQEGQSVDYPSTVEYRCQRGYTIDGQIGGRGSFNRDCQADGQFSAAERCQPVSCGQPPQVAHSTFPTSSRTYGEDVVYTCTSGYSTTGVAGGPTAFNVTCEAEGFTSPRECRRVSCGRCPRNSDAFRHALPEQTADRVYEDQCSYRCEEGYTTTGRSGGPVSFNTSCLASGNFSRAQGCSPVTCGQPPSPPNASISSATGQLHFPQAASFDCARGHTLDGLAGGPRHFRLQCLANGSFEAAPRCSPVRCGRPVEVAEASYRTHARTYDEQVTYTCSSGYTIDGTPNGPREAAMTCGANGTFTGEVPTCLPVVCGPPPAAPNAEATEEGPVVFPDTITYECKEGHTITGAERGRASFQRTCQANGTFSWARDCLPIVCGQPPHVSNSSYPRRNVTYPQQVTYTCDAGHTVNGQASGDASFNVSCRASGFSPTQHCQKVECGRCPTLPDADSLARGERAYGDSCDYACKPGYTLTADATGATTFSTSCNASGGFTPPPRCRPVTCGGAPSSAGARIVGIAERRVSYPTSVSYECYPGHTANGQPGGSAQFTRRCLANGTFSSGQPCTPVACGEPGSFDHATHSAGVRVYNESVEYTCDRGFTRNGSAAAPTRAVLRCGASGEFEGTAPSCMPVTCGAAPRTPTAHPTSASSNGQVRFPDAAEYECSAGHTLTGQPGNETRFQRQCQATGEFAPVQSCRPVTCGQPPEVQHATCPREAVVYPGAVTYECDAGYTVDASPEGPRRFNVSCGPQGFSAPGSCRGVSCGSCPQLRRRNPHATPQTTTAQSYGGKCQYTCKRGYSLDHRAAGPTTFETTCGGNGQYSRAQVCVPVSCGVPGALSHASTSQTNRSAEILYPDTVEYSCERGHTLSGTASGRSSFERQCQANGSLSAAPAEGCLPVQCGEPAPVAHAVFSPGERAYGESVTYTCEEGYTLDGTAGSEREATLRCRAGGRFGGDPLPTCQPVTCGQPQELQKASIESNHDGQVTYTETVVYKCKRGYTVTGLADGAKRFERRCGADGQFTQGETCQAISCGAAPAVAHSTHSVVSGGDLTYGQQVRYTCDEGFSTTATADGARRFNVTCDRSGVLAPNQRCQAISCGSCPDPAGEMPHAVLQSSGQTRVYSQGCAYECERGYTLNSQASGPRTFNVSCGADGTFSQTRNTCMPVSCGSPGTVTNASLRTRGSDAARGFAYSERAEYECLAGHTITGEAGGATTFQRRCKANGEFAPAPAESCQPVLCGEPPEVEGARHTAGPRRFNDNVTYVCTRLRTLTGRPDGGREVTLRCGADGRFEGTQPRCRPVECGIPPELESAALEEERGMEQITAASDPLRYRCLGGYSTQRDDDPWHPTHSSFNITCFSNGTFSPAPTCVNIDDCPHRHCGRHGFCEDKENPEGVPENDFRCVCDPGFQVVRFPNPAHPGGLDQTCVAVDDCPATDPCGGTNSKGLPRGVCHDGMGTYTCECSDGYQQSTLPELPENQTCTPIKCGRIPQVDNADASTSKRRADTDTPSWTYTCHRGYTITGEVDGATSWKGKCRKSGQFANVERCKPIKCGPLPEVPHATTLTEVRKLRYNETAEFKCDRGFVVEGAGGRIFTVKCRSNGRLSRPSTCVLKERSMFVQERPGHLRRNEQRPVDKLDEATL